MTFALFSVFLFLFLHPEEQIHEPIEIRIHGRVEPESPTHTQPAGAPLRQSAPWRGVTVTTASTRRAVDQFLMKAQPRDTIVAFVAGHGVRTEHKVYYFLTPDSTPDDPYAGIDRGTIEALVLSEKLHANRRLLLLDTCHAGELIPGDRGRAAEALVDQDEVNTFGGSAEGKGIYIFAASTDAGFAQEQDGNGVFTRALLDGLKGDADGKPFGNQNGLVEIEELKTIVRFGVLEMTEGRQKATVPKVIAGEDFPIGRAGAGR